MGLAKVPPRSEVGEIYFLMLPIGPEVFNYFFARIVGKERVIKMPVCATPLASRRELNLKGKGRVIKESTGDDFRGVDRR